VLYATVLIWQTYYAIATLRRTLWGTRSAGAADTSIPFHICDYIAGTGTSGGSESASQGVIADKVVEFSNTLRMRVISAVALPLSIVPFLVFGMYDSTGSMLVLRAQRVFVAPAAATLTPLERSRVEGGLLSFRDRVVVLAYPRVGDGNFTSEPKVSVRQFASEIALLHGAGANPVSIEQVEAWRLHGKTLPRNAVLITFDGATADLALNAAPILRRHGFPATVFVRGGAYEQSPVQMMSRTQVRALARDGWSIGAASSQPDMRIRASADTSDPPMPFLTAVRWKGSKFEGPQAYARRASREFGAARRAAAQLAGRRVSAFAYPYGAYGQAGYRNDATVQTANQDLVMSTFDIAFTMTPPERYRPLGERSRMDEVPRLVIRPWSSDSFMYHVVNAAAMPLVAQPPAHTEPNTES
jgi:peptidoglycan/xylan/chitin deacetylase (PgdA/CDA1 family)